MRVVRAPLLALLWLAANVLGFTLAGAFARFPGSFPVGSGVNSSFDAAAALFGLVLGGVSGAVVGVLQWLVLRRWIGAGRGWIAATALAIAVTHMLGDGLPVSFDYESIAVDGGVLFYVAQTIALRGRSGGQALALAGAVGYAVGILAGVDRATSSEVYWGEEHLVAGIVCGIAFGAVSVVTLLLSRWSVAAVQRR